MSFVPSPGLTPFDGYVESLAAAIADGTALNWADAELHATSDDDRERLHQLRALAALVYVHRLWHESSHDTSPSPGGRIAPPRPVPPALSNFTVLKVVGSPLIACLAKAVLASCTRPTIMNDTPISL